MKINIVVADDEYFIRQRIKKILPIEELNLNLVGEAENGVEVINLLKSMSVDLILLDIKMPKMSGIEVAQYVHEHYPFVEIIILSGYNEFEYARSTMKSGVADYLLKPVEKSALDSAITDCVRQIIKTKQEQAQIQKLHHYDKCTDLTNVVNGSLSIDTLFFKYPSLSTKKFALYIGIFINDETSHTINNLVLRLQVKGFNCESFQETDHTYTILLFSECREDISCIGSFFVDIISTNTLYTFISMGHIFEITSDWSIYYKRALYLLNYRYFSPISNLQLEYETLPEKSLHPNLSKIRQNLIIYINTNNVVKFEEYLDSLFADIYRQRTIEYMHLIVTEIFITYNIHYPDKIASHHNISEFMLSVMDDDYLLDNLKATAISYGIQCMKQVENAPSDIQFNEKLTSYISEHYMDSELSVAKLSDVFHLNASYMGTLFKKVNNQSILQYMIQVRMEAAKNLLLSTDHSITEVAELVGYTDVFYFSKRFRKMYGSSPKDFLLKNSKKL